MASPLKKKAGSSVDPSSLNHNNIAYKYAGVRSRHKISLPRRIVIGEQQAIRRYPGEIREIKHGVDGAVYAEDLEKEEALMRESLGMSQEISKENLLHEADFLKIDQSKLPLDIFDNLEFASADKSPREWLSICKLGFTPFYSSGEWSWAKVIIHKYNEDTNDYHVQFSPNGSYKNVSRLNLRFEAENEAAFNARRAFANDARDEAKKILRLDHFIHQQPTEATRAIRQVSLHKIHERIIDGLAVGIPFPEPGSALGFLLSNLTKELIRWYTRTMKKTVLFAQLSDAPRFRKEAAVLRYKQLELPSLPPKSRVPYSAKVACASFPFHERRNKIAAAHCSSIKEVLNVYKWLQERWEKKFQHYSFMDIKLTGLCLFHHYPIS